MYREQPNTATETANEYYLSGLFKITKAAITPGTQPQSHSKKTIKIEPQPLSKTAKGGQKIERRTLQILIRLILMIDDYLCDAHTCNLLHLFEYLEEFTIYKVLLKHL